jgi:uncharacterized protein (TIGR02598 family)
LPHKSLSMQSAVSIHAHQPVAIRRGRGFSLVETVLAMAVMSLAVTVLLGLLPHGLEMSRKAGVSAGEARVTTEILGELSQVDWNSLATYDNKRFYFDDQGVRLSENAGLEIAYVAEVQLPVPINLPGASVPSDNLRRVVLDIASTPNTKFEFKDGQTFSTYTSILCRTD